METTVEKIVMKIGFRRLYNVFKFVRNIYMFLDMVTDSVLGYSLVNGYKKDREMSKSSVETSGHLVKIIGKVIYTKYSKYCLKESSCANQLCRLHGQTAPFIEELQTVATDITKIDFFTLLTTSHLIWVLFTSQNMLQFATLWYIIS